MVALAGLDASRFLRCRDPLEREAVQAAAARTLKLRQLVDQNRAVLIANAVGQMLKGTSG